MGFDFDMTETAGVFMVLFILALIALFPAVLAWSWNAILAAHFGLFHMTYTEACATIILLFTVKGIVGANNVTVNQK